VERGIIVLGDLVGRIDGLAEETFYAVDRYTIPLPFPLVTS
jgi:hypothetical protein